MNSCLRGLLHFQLLSTRYSQCSTIDVSPGRVASGQLISAVLHYKAICHLQPLILRRPELVRLAYHLIFSTMFIRQRYAVCTNHPSTDRRCSRGWIVLECRRTTWRSISGGKSGSVASNTHRVSFMLHKSVPPETSLCLITHYTEERLCPSRINR